MWPNEIRIAYKTGMSIADISKLYGVKRYWIKKALVGITRSVADTNSMKARLASRDLSESEKQCILGTLLGDGCLRFSPNGRSSFLSVTHGSKQELYVRHKHKVLIGSHLYKEINKAGYCPGSIQWRMNYYNPRFMDLVRSVSNRDGIKTVTREWLSLLDLEGLSYWFMDDGSSSYGSNPGRSVGVLISTMCFSREENELLSEKLNKYDSDARVVRASRGTRWQISFSVAGGQKFLRLIQPYVERVPSMIYKLKIS